MGDLIFECVGAEAERHAAVPTILLKLRITEPSGAAIHAIALHTQLRIETQRRHYAPAESDRLLELFGELSRWGDTLKPLHFTNLSTIVPAFTGSTTIDLPVPCTYDFEVTAAKYLQALDDGEIPLLLLFNGSIFARADNGFSVVPVPWHLEASYRLPVRVWRDVMDRYFPQSAWIRMRRETFDALQHYKARQALPTWDAALEALLARVAGEHGP